MTPHTRYSAEWLVANCDTEIAFERAVKREMSRMMDEREELLKALNLALEYWSHRQQRYTNRSPVWVQDARALISLTTTTEK